MPYFSETGELLGQLPGHHNIFEIYLHIYSSFFLFLAGLISIALVYYTLKKTDYSCPPILGGLFYVSLIGLGEGAESFSFFNPFIQSIFHYLHLISSPPAVFSLYIGIKEIASLEVKGKSKAKSRSILSGVGVFLAVIVGVIIMAYISKMPYNEQVEGPFLLAIFLPTLYFVILVFKESRHFARSTELLYLPILSIVVSLLVLDIWAGRFADVNRLADLYILTHSFQDIFLVLSGGIALLFSINLWYSKRIQRLFVLDDSIVEEVQTQSPSEVS
jgi:hypothetical protein